MDKLDPPRTFGVFKPVGHTVIAFTREEMLVEATRKLQAAAIPEDEITTYSPQEMQLQTEQDLAQASAFADVGQELNLVRLHHQLSLDGCHFLVVKTADDERARMVSKLALECGALTAQQYGRFMIEDLIDPAGGKGQIFESPSRGLDSKVLKQNRHL